MKCPQCGLIHVSYIDDDVEELAYRVIENSVKELLMNCIIKCDT